MEDEVQKERNENAQKILDYLKNYQQNYKEIPTFMQIAFYTKMPIPMIKVLIQDFENKGIIKRGKNFITINGR